MVLAWILGILALLCLILCLTRIQVLARMEGENLSLFLRAGVLKLRLYPPKPRKKKERPERQKKKKKPEEETPPEGRFPVPSPEDLLDALRSLPPPILRALVRTARGIRIHPLSLSIVFGGWDDPPNAAERYGYASAALYTGMPLLERIFQIPKPDIRLDVDFSTPRTAVEGEAGVSLRVGTIFAAGFTVAVPAALWVVRSMRRRGAKERENRTREAEEETKTENAEIEDEGKTA